MPLILTAAYASTYVLMISVFSMIGRFFWALTSDCIGRKAPCMWFFVRGAILYLSTPRLDRACAENPSILSRAGLCLASLFARNIWTRWFDSRSG
jgi:hypothetical protein